MNEKSIHLIFSDNTKAALQKINICDQYLGLLEGTRTALSRVEVEGVNDRRMRIEYMATDGKPCGEYIVEPELVPEMWGNTFKGNCLKEYEVVACFQTYEDGYYLDLKVEFNASKDEILNLGSTLDNIAAGIEYKKYCEHICIDDLI